MSRQRPNAPGKSRAGQFTEGSSGGSATVYLDLASSFSGTLRGGLTEICGTCSFDQGSCQPLPAGAMPMVQGPFFGRAALHTIPGEPFDVLSDDIVILGQ